MKKRCYNSSWCLLLVVIISFAAKDVTSQGAYNYTKLEVAPYTVLAYADFYSSLFMIAVVTIISTGPTRGVVHFLTNDSNTSTQVNLDDLKPSIAGLNFEIHEFPVDYSLAPDVRCRREYLGPLIRFGVLQGHRILATTRELILHSIVLRKPGDSAVISCGTIAPLSLPDFSSIVNFRTNISGFVTVFQWERKWRTFHGVWCMISKPHGSVANISMQRCQ